MGSARKVTWWLAVPVGIAVGLALAVAIDRAAGPAAAQGGGAGGFTLSIEQLKINQRIGQAGVRRANRANDRLDRLGSAPPVVPPGGPAQPGPSTARIAFAAPAGSAAQTVLDLAGITLSAVCEAGPAGEASLAIRAAVAEATSFAGNSAVDTGTDPTNPGQAFVVNLQQALAPGPAALLGGPAAAPDGEFVRVMSNAVLVAPSRTVSLHVSVFTDGAADRCSLNGVAVAAP